MLDVFVHYPVPAFHRVSLFPRSLAEGLQLQPPPSLRKDLKLNTVSLAVSSCRVPEMNQDWQQAVRPCYFPAPVSEGRSDTVSGGNTEVVPRASERTQLKILRAHRILFSPFEKGFQGGIAIVIAVMSF